jgi:hypothetical protein
MQPDSIYRFQSTLFLHSFSPLFAHSSLSLGLQCGGRIALFPDRC